MVWHPYEDDMRDFDDESGHTWRAGIDGRPGSDYKGRYHLVLRGGDGEDEVALTDVRWNSERSAARTLASMSVWELRRRLSTARGRANPERG
jgi:hypothetical protein